MHLGILGEEDCVSMETDCRFSYLTYPALPPHFRRISLGHISLKIPQIKVQISVCFSLLCLKNIAYIFCVCVCGRGKQVSFWKRYNKVIGNSAQILTCGKRVAGESIGKWE